jgi:hypothetical protein
MHAEAVVVFAEGGFEGLQVVVVVVNAMGYVEGRRGGIEGRILGETAKRRCTAEDQCNGALVDTGWVAESNDFELASVSVYCRDWVQFVLPAGSYFTWPC